MKGLNQKEPRLGTWAENFLVTKLEALDQAAVTIDILAFEIIEHTTTFTDHQKQTAIGMEIVLVLLHVGGQVVDTGGQESDLNFRGTSVTLMGRVLGNDLLLFRIAECHSGLLDSLRGAPTRCRSALYPRAILTPKSNSTIRSL